MQNKFTMLCVLWDNIVAKFAAEAEARGHERAKELAAVIADIPVRVRDYVLR